MVTRHSKQMPIPHKGARGSPETEVRQRHSPAIKTAAATDVPAATRSGLPFTSMAISSNMNGIPPVWGIRIARNGRLPAEDGIRQEPCRGKRSGDAQPFV